MFQIVSNPFVEMTQGVVSSGLGYIVKRSEKSKNSAWFWLITAAILTIIYLAILSKNQDKKHQRKLEEEQSKFEKRRMKSLKQ